MLNNKSQILSALSPPLAANSTIGILGAGQLGRMICFAAHQLGYRTVIFSDIKNSPASLVSNKTIVAPYDDQEALNKFASEIDIATFEFENIPVNTVEFISKIKPIYPSAKVLKVTQNRLNEKDFLRKNDIAVTNYSSISSLKQLQSSLVSLAAVNGKAILKMVVMGYDGKGQFILDKNSDLEAVWQQNKSNKIKGSQVKPIKPMIILEEFVEFEQEISVIAVRNVNKQITCYPPLTNIHKNGILDQSIYPAKINEIVAKKAQEIAVKIVNAFDLTGVLAIEFFVLKNGSLLVNELAPRPHNSGHFSMDACITSQFEQLVRAITGIPLGSVKFHSQGYMKNLIGYEVNHIEKYLQNKQAKIHLYGKEKIKEGRKMGHINILENYTKSHL